MPEFRIMEILKMVLQTLIFTGVILLGLNVAYLLVFSIAGHFYSGPRKNETPHHAFNRFRVVIPSYKEDNVIIESASSVLNQNYPDKLLECYVIADELKKETTHQLRNMGCRVLEINPDSKRNKAKAIRHFLDQLPDDECIYLVLDADNLLEKNGLTKADQYFQSGVKVLQACRIAKNEENAMSRMDSFSEIINNHIFRKGQRKMGFSCSLIGSGMFFEGDLFRELMMNMDIISGFDKELELRILKKQILIEYAEDIKVKDEKVSDRSTFIQQRRRWIYAQWYFLKKDLIPSLNLLWKKGTVDHFNKVVQFMLFPRGISIGLSVLLVIVSMLINSSTILISVTLTFLLLFALYLPVCKKTTVKELSSLLSYMPGAITGMFEALFTSRRAAGKFLHTPHKN
jgi:cellulose synthase/poly-beta-1,6-N-acetylglucosamine synthase-like glycosyltransferase